MRTDNGDTGPASLPRQTVIVTGGNSGLGYGCASALLSASPSWHVVIACRDIERAQYPAAVRFAWHNILPRFIPLLRLLLVKNIHTPEESGEALARLIVDAALSSTNGRYFEGLREIPSSAESYDKDRVEELWRESATLTGIEPLP